ncbi:hypothetical protein ABIB82_004830 [Bradyrhizobium sp. i1.8.4]
MPCVGYAKSATDRGLHPRQQTPHSRSHRERTLSHKERVNRHAAAVGKV